MIALLRVAEGVLAGEQLVEDDAQREQIADRGGGRAGDDLGRGVGRLALEDAGLGAVRDALQLGDAEVRHLHLTLARHEDVGRRDVPVGHEHRPAVVGAPVGVGEAGERLQTDEGHQVRREADALLLRAADQRAQVPPVHQLHHQEEPVGIAAHVVHADQVLVVQVGGQLRLGQEHGRDGLVLGQVAEDALDGHGLLEALGPTGDAQEQLRHASRGQGPHEPVAFVHGSSLRCPQP